MKRSLSVRHVVALGIVVVGLAPAACRGNPNVPDDPQVTYGQSCTRTGAAFCTCVGVAVPECASLFSTACLVGKDPNALSDRTESQTQICERALSTGCASVMTAQVPPECPQLSSLQLPYPH